MAQSINLGVTPIPAGTREFVVDSLPANSSGFELALGVNASWATGSGTLFELLLEFSSDGAIFNPWVRFSIVRGAHLAKDGSQLSLWRCQGTWPGQADGSGNRIPIPAAALRVTLTVPSLFTCDSVALSVA